MGDRFGRLAGLPAAMKSVLSSDDSLLSHLGMQKGDRLEAINRYPATDVQKCRVRCLCAGWPPRHERIRRPWQALADIEPGSAFLTELDSSPFPTGLDLTSIYTCNDE